MLLQCQWTSLDGINIILSEWIPKLTNKVNVKFCSLFTFSHWLTRFDFTQIDNLKFEIGNILLAIGIHQDANGKYCCNTSLIVVAMDWARQRIDNQTETLCTGKILIFLLVLGKLFAIDLWSSNQLNHLCKSS